MIQIREIVTALGEQSRLTHTPYTDYLCVGVFPFIANYPGDGTEGVYADSILAATHYYSFNRIRFAEGETPPITSIVGTAGEYGIPYVILYQQISPELQST